MDPIMAKLGICILIIVIILVSYRIITMSKDSREREFRQILYSIMAMIVVAALGWLLWQVANIIYDSL